MELCAICEEPDELSKFSCGCYLHDNCRYEKYGKGLSNCKECSVLLKEELTEGSKIAFGFTSTFFGLILLCLICDIIYLTLWVYLSYLWHLCFLDI